MHGHLALSTIQTQMPKGSISIAAWRGLKPFRTRPEEIRVLLYSLIKQSNGKLLPKYVVSSFKLTGGKLLEVLALGKSSK